MTTKTLTLRKLGLLGALALAAAPQPQAAEISGNIKYLQQAQSGTQSYVEPNVFYALPGKVNGYTWADLPGDGTFFGKTSLSRTLAGKLDATAQLVHANEALSQAGLGLSYNIPLTRKNSYANVKILPVWATKEGKMLPGNALLGYAIGTDLGNGWSLESFAEFNANSMSGNQKFAGKRAFDWGYGEVELTKKVSKNLKLGVNAGLFNNGRNNAPEPRVRLEGRYDFNIKIPSKKEAAK
jgi:hypothetical protein